MFKLGKMYLTNGINIEIGDSNIFAKEIMKCIGRYRRKDWGELPEEDKELNEKAIQNGNDRILAAYQTSKGKIYIITEYTEELKDFVTTVMFASEY